MSYWPSSYEYFYKLRGDDMDSNIHTENVQLARRLAVTHKREVTIWQDGELEYVRLGMPAEDAEAQTNAILKGWHWITIVRPPK